MIATGKTIIVPAAPICPHSTLTGVAYSLSPTGAVLTVEPDNKLANKNSFQEKK